MQLEQIGQKGGITAIVLSLLLSMFSNYTNVAQNSEEQEEQQQDLIMRTEMDKDIEAIIAENINLQSQINRLEEWREADKEAFQKFQLDYYRGNFVIPE